MAEKYKLIQTIAAQAAREVTKDSESWMDFLGTAAKVYKYPFKDQLLIYAQNPQASACASMKVWNEKLDRWVNKGAKGIALIDDRPERPRLTYVFDIASTHKGAEGKDPYIWSVKEEDWQQLTAYLKRYYKNIDSKSLKETLKEAAKAQVEETADSYLQAASDPLTGIPIPGTDTETFRNRFRETFIGSLTYMLLTRCGIPTAELFDENSFPHISDFQDISILTHLGNAVSETARDMLWDIGHLAHHIAKAKTVNRGIYREPVKHTEMIRKEQTTGEKKGEDRDERSNGKSDPLQGKGRDPVSRPEAGRDTANADRKIRQASGEIPEGAPAGNLPEPAPVRTADIPPAADRPAGREVYDSDRDTAVKRGESGAEPALQGSEDLEKRDGTDPGENPRDNTDHASQHMTDPIYTPIEAKDHTTLSSIPFSHGIPLPVIDEMLRRGGNKERGELRIAAHFIEEAGNDAAFLLNEYGKGGQSFVVNGKEYTVWFDRDGLILSPGSTLEIHSCLPLTWQQAADRTRELMTAGEYLPQAILTRALINERLETAAALYHLHEEGCPLPFLKDTILQGNFTESVKNIAGRLSEEAFLTESIRELQSVTNRGGTNGNRERRENTEPNHLNPEEILTRLNNYSSFLKASPPMQEQAIAVSQREPPEKKPSIMENLERTRQEVTQRDAFRQRAIPEKPRMTGLAL